ncbi:MAG: hypothetical protein AAF645_12965, partial [Myxococcota bacterium]
MPRSAYLFHLIVRAHIGQALVHDVHARIVVRDDRRLVAGEREDEEEKVRRTGHARRKSKA